jgi:hypothetical protein
MPEIWLRYGSTDIALDIRFENLYKELVPTLSGLSDEQLNYKLQEIPLKENSLIIVMSSSGVTKQVLSRIVDSAYTKGVNGINIVTLPKLNDFIDIQNEKYTYSLLNAKDLPSLSEIMTKFQATFFLCHSAYDPLFGFEGTPTQLLRNFNQDKMAEAIRLRSSDMPSPGVISEPHSLALSECESINATSIEIVGNSNILLDIYCGSLEESFKKASSKLIEGSVFEAHSVRSEIICPGSDPIYHYTLTDSLNCLWNCANILSENGSAILLSEARGGLGSKALEMFVQGRLLVPLPAEREIYIEGQEHLMFLDSIRKKCDIGVVSTIPQYYLKNKLGLETFDSLKQVLANLLLKYGKNHKVTLIPDARSTLPRLGNGFKKEFQLPDKTG